MALKAGSFATYLIVCPTSFFLGIIFSLFPYDYPILWSASPTPASHFDYLEAHLRFLHASPPLIPRILHIVIFVGLAGLIMKLYRPSESNMLFDGASLVLYMAGVTVYIANIVKGLRLVTAGKYGSELATSPEDDGQILGREDSLKVLSASNTILALVLVGVLVLQAGQWYAERKEAQELEKMELEQQQHQHQHQHQHQQKKSEEKEKKEGGGAVEDVAASAAGSSSATASGRVTRQASKRK